MHWSRLIFPLFTQLVCEKGSFITDTGTISLEGSNISDPLSSVTWPVGRVLCSVNSPKGIMVNNNKSTHFSASLLCKSYCQWKKKIPILVPLLEGEDEEVYCKILNGQKHNQTSNGLSLESTNLELVKTDKPAYLIFMLQEANLLS